MLKYVIKRLVLAFFTLLIILSITFILMKLLPLEIPVDKAQKAIYLGEQIKLGYVFDSPFKITGYGKEIAMVVSEDTGKTTYYYNVPIFQQLFLWFKNIVTSGKWGTSTNVWVNVDAFVIIMKRLPNSIKINIISVIFSVPLGIFLGIVAALNKNKPVDNVISTLVMMIVSIPGFVLIILSQQYLGFQWKILPATFTKSNDPVLIAKSYILPVILLSLGSICGYCRAVRGELCEVMESEYLLLARTKGLTKRQAIIRHALRNAMVPIVPSILAEFIGILGGSMILEYVFEINGIGGLFIKAIETKDYNVLMVDMAFFTTISLTAGVFLDISYGFIDPRIRMGERQYERKRITRK